MSVRVPQSAKSTKKLREEAWEAVTKSLIPDLQEYSDIEKSYLGKSTLQNHSIILQGLS